MQIRAPHISASIAKAITFPTLSSPSSLWFALYMRILAFTRLLKLHLTLFRPADFTSLRSNVWNIDEDDYVSSFQEGELVPVGNLGYSGSTFFTTRDGRFLIKSLPRRFEYKFFSEDLFVPYLEHMEAHPDALLVRITDMPYAKYHSVGGILGAAPPCHIVMENLLQGEEEWETFDLKPKDYFFPERDIANGALVRDEVIEGLVDDLPDKARVPARARAALLAQLEKDTDILQANQAVDYSLFLARTRTRGDTDNDDDSVGSWREGVRGEDGWTYRAVVLDFFWTKSAGQAKAMEGLVRAFNTVADKGPMSITADPEEYRERFLKMVGALVKGV
ncbi:uncharacterized protein J7T54_007127 [Emericellopsis cladophorae]|uniref:PIPK domain-containing protein n=1 Tax=Emericellopsis cladophorae TaxID=2686198 RepID=A0A9P9Y8F6_9HYPO|nr:uncharacterized protein J7T54_007127 [Emericellopsis cladophorae]KAI6785484.1 hypothetical protein J7T54_007127 [Emericellopsis cladophorae]